MIKNIFKSIELIITINILIFVCTGIISCRNTNGILESNKGEAIVKIALKGSDFRDNKNLGSQAGIKSVGIQSKNEQKEEISFKGNDDYKLVATLTPVNTTDAVAQASSKVSSVAATKTNPLDSGVKYKVVVYDSNGKYIKEQDYTSGQSGSDITGLNGGETYTFIVYSVGSKTDLPAVTYSDSTNKTLPTAILDNVSGDNDLMYFSKVVEVSGDSVNYLDITLKHKFSQITTILDTVPTTYFVTNINGVTIAPHNSTAKIQLSDGSTTVKGTNEEKLITFSALNSNTIKGNSVFLNSNDILNGVLKIKSITMKTNDNATLTHQNISFNNLKITRGVQYNLKLSFVPNDKYLTYRGYPAARINGFIWMRHNLGVDTSLDSNQDPQIKELHGRFYQSGKRDYVADANTSSGSLSGWDNTISSINSWNSGTETNPQKTANDPCPSGWRIPTANEFGSLISNVTFTNRDTWIKESVLPDYSGENNFKPSKVFTSKYNNKITLVFPVAGFRIGYHGDKYKYKNGELGSRAQYGYYLSSSRDNTNKFSRYMRVDVNNVTVRSNDATDGMNIRCIAESPLSPPY
ncbi:FISUMP domain-containing protein [Elizabethkingia ursingii]|uniref:FISUMP domain-containing protein n=1 Tax=Elizabethkingia ursingii TaxID=1756150 RepID=UPI0009996D4C|nr:FISUMP domain-containing protein [Elizabethkingia ursingii]